jgi:micrococcal nuclease
MKTLTIIDLSIVVSVFLLLKVFSLKKFTLVEIIDGDTIKVNLNGKIETVRYLLMDTLESKNPKKCVQLYAKEAFLRNSKLVKSGMVTLEFEGENTRDAYRRLLAYVFVDGESIQGTLLREGVRTCGVYHESTL